MATKQLSPEEIADLPASDLVEIVLALRRVLFPDGSADQEWDSDTLGQIAEVCVRYGLVPADSDHPRRFLH